MLSENRRILYIHWSESETPGRAARLEALGYSVDWMAEIDPRLAKIRAKPPALVVIDLDRLPSHGREAGMALRSYKDTRDLPILFVGGLPDKIERVRASLPDAHYCSWNEVAGIIPGLLTNPLPETQWAASVMDAYRGAPLAKKLGVKANRSVLLVDSPDGFPDQVEGWPEGVQWAKFGEDFPGGLVLWFVTSRLELMAKWNQVLRQVGKEGIWFVWPKKTSKVKTDLTQQVVREIGLGAGLVDFKVCAVDETWTGLKFVWRKK
jgi:CheY-like chemotaxis protein